MTSAQRKRVLDLVAERRHSYAVIAKRCGVTRGSIAGVVFRARHPRKTLVKSGLRGKRYRTGYGWQPRSYDPEITINDAGAL